MKECAACTWHTQLTHSRYRTHHYQKQDTPQDVIIHPLLESAPLVPRPRVVQHCFGFMTFRHTKHIWLGWPSSRWWQQHRSVHLEKKATWEEGLYGNDTPQPLPNPHPHHTPPLKSPSISQPRAGNHTSDPSMESIDIKNTCAKAKKSQDDKAASILNILILWYTSLGL